jgi:hypothetical protein
MSKCVFFYIILLIFSVPKVNAQNFSADLIPDSLKENAHCVIRDYTLEVELKSTNSGLERIRKVFTILDKDGENSAYLAIPYDKNSSVNITQIILFDSSGKKIKNVKQSEIEDFPGYSASELFSENRIKFYKPNQAEFPYSIEYNYEINSSNILSFASWRPYTNYNISTQHASLKLIHPLTVIINKKEVKVNIKSSEVNKNQRVETWELNNVKAIEEEPFDISITERIPCVYLMPAILIYNKYEGSANNWKEFGKWIYGLYQGRDQLSDAEKLKVEVLLRDIPDTLDRIRTLYEYMQENTRYVAITLGIGGFQPFDAKTVFETGYGDCKALSNYMYSLLKFKGIKSYPALVASGSYKVPIFNDYPNFQQFNHVILCVPGIKDTIWLECTDQKIPFGFLGDFTDDRDVLLLTENGGQFEHTRRYDALDNLRICNSEINIDSTGTATCSTKTLFKGLQYNNISKLLSSNYEEQKKWLYNNSTLPSLQINKFSIVNIRNTLPLAMINESSVSKNFCSFTGNYMLLSMNLLNAQKPIQKMLKSRYSDIIINRSFIDYDTLVYQIPKNFIFESLPPGKNIDSRFGNYSYSVTQNDNKIIYSRKFLIKQGRYKPSEYKDFYEFILSVSKADNVKMILTKKT